jgi:hypothetical protein
LSVVPACNVRIRFEPVATKQASLVVRHLRGDSEIARECRPLAPGAAALDVKTHPESTHVACALQVDGTPVRDASFSVVCGEPIAPTGKHFIVVGAMKAGTTTLFQTLARHPAICRTWVEHPGSGTSKEINYFQTLFNRDDTPLHYDWRFPFDASRHAWTLDVSTGYAKLPGSRPVAARIASLGAQTKLAYILREPVDRIESQIAHTLRGGGEVRNLHHCIRVSRYAWHLDHFTARLPREQILLLDFAQLRRRPGAVLDQLCDFLEIDRFVTHTGVHNKRVVDYRLTAAQRTEFAEAVRPDVQRLIEKYDFEPAEKWLRGWERPRFWLPRFRR